VKKKILIASIREASIIDQVFKEYHWEWYVTSVFPFIIAPKDFDGWVDQLEELVLLKEHGQVLATTIEKSHCIMSTMWEHGMILVSDKITRPELTERTRAVAAEHDLTLTTSEAESEGGHS
jgi:hypothetical protein